MRDSGLTFRGVKIYWDDTPMGKAEATVADYLVEQVENVGGMCDKLHCESERGFPDYLITWPSGDMKKVETKSKDGVCSVTQDRYHRMSAKRLCFVAVLHTRALVDQFMDIHRINWEGYP